MLPNIPEAKLAYFAGLIDGEGSIGITRLTFPANRSGVHFAPFVTMTNTHRGIMEEFHTLFGLCTKITDHMGGNNAKLKQNKACFRIVSNKAGKIKPVLEALIPYLTIKKEQALNVLKLIEVKSNTGNYSHNDTVDEQFNLYINARNLNGADLSNEEVESLRPVIRPVKVREYKKKVKLEK